MLRTQIYLEEKSSKALKALATREGKKQSELIRQAIDQFLSMKAPQKRSERLKKFRGMWKGKKDIPNFKKLRQEWNRFDDGR